MRHFPSEPAGSRSLATNSPARSDTVISQAKCWLCILQSQNAGGTAETVFPSRILVGFGTFLSPTQNDKLKFISLPQRGRGTTKWWMRRSPFCGFYVFCEPCFVAKESLCHKTKSTKQRVARLDGDLLIHHFVVPRKARFACKRCYEGLPELFSAGEGYSQPTDKSKFEPLNQF